jgi:hypothetical protein
MLKKFVVLLVLIALAFGGYYIYQQVHEQRVDESGEVHCVGCMSPDRAAAYQKENSGDTPDGQSERKTRTAAADSKAAANGTPGTAAGVTAQSAAPTAPNTTPVTPTPAAQPVANSLPASDSELPNAPNGMRFAGTGPYQWYRQGNLTWRIDTNTGRSCIIYATMDEWQKPVVIEHGCGRTT